MLRLGPQVFAGFFGEVADGGGALLRVDKGVPARLVIYTAAIVYLFLDLFVFAGPLRQKIRKHSSRSPEQIAAAKAQGVVARFYGQPILLTQVDRRVAERLWKEGRKLEDVPDVERRVLRMAALNDLIDLRLLGRIKVWANKGKYPVSEEEIDAAVARFRKKFDSEKELKDGLLEQGWSEKELRMRLAARMQQDKYLAALIDLTISEEEAREFYDNHKEELALPQRMRVRHVFLAAEQHEAAEADKMMVEAMTRLTSGLVTFEELAAEMSEDPTSKDSGGELGWVQAGRLPEELAVQLATMEPLKPMAVQTKLGWHLVELLERKERSLQSFEEVRPAIEIALQGIKREEGMQGYRYQLRNIAKGKVEVYRDRF